MTTKHELDNLQPQSVWAHFARLCRIPHASRKEAALIANLLGWAQQRGIAALIDDAGNLILRKPATPGSASLPGVILQSHLDMVCQANAGTRHDFERDAIHAMVRDGWVLAEETTLGADNGIGVALILAALEQDDLQHPALEALLTVNEESGMDGAQGLQAGTLRGNILINLDSEEWGHFYLGCAGGVDVHVAQNSALQQIPQDYVLLRFEVGGLQGGHSGLDIHHGRGNAIKLLASALRSLAGQGDLRLIEMAGGSARNAIPREAYALCALPADAEPALEAWRVELLAQWRQQFAATDAGVNFSVRRLESAEQGDSTDALPNVERDSLQTFLDTVDNGVAQLSADFPGVTDSSSNLGVLALLNGNLNITCKVRSLQDERADALAKKIISHAGKHGLQAWQDGAYPGWMPDPSSRLLALCQQVYQAQFGQPASVQVIHAGLECGLFAASHPQLQMISFGPDIRGAHAPGERVEIASVAHCWQLLQALLRALAKQDG